MADGLVRRLVIAACAAVVLGSGSGPVVQAQTAPDIVPTTYERPRLVDFFGGGFLEMQ